MPPPTDTGLILVLLMVNSTFFGTNCSYFCCFHLPEIIMKIKEQYHVSCPCLNHKYLSQNLPKKNIVHVGGVLKTSGPTDSKSVPGFEN